jgi:hypothetical protein
MKKNSGSLNENNPNLMKRRSKHDVEGRDYTCPICKKGYLSYAALYTHRKSKHETENKQRGRGRPKKEENENLIEKNRYNPINFTFFAKEGRTGKTNLTEINNCIDKAFIELYSECNSEINKSRNMKKYSSIEEHPFLDKFKKDAHDIYKNVINLHEIIDRVFIDYLNKMSVFCSFTYFSELIKFVTLFREYINIVNRKTENDINEYTEISGAENVPNYCNSFINNFLFLNGKESDFSFSKEESIDLIQNLCYWMFDNNFTSYKICLKN